jgi:DNA polymerase III gamma/tau subunit
MRERLRAQANQLGEAIVLRLCDLLAVAIDDMRQGGDPRLPLELALVKVTRPASDMERESVAYRLEQLEQRTHGSAPAEPINTVLQGEEKPVAVDVPASEPPSIELSQLQEAWQRTILPAVEQKSIPTASMLREAHPSQLANDRLTVEFPAAASFHRQLAEEPRNATLLADALYEVTGRKLALDFAVGENGGEEPELNEEPAGEDRIIQLMKDEFDAREIEGDTD